MIVASLRISGETRLFSALLFATSSWRAAPHVFQQRDPNMSAMLFAQQILNGLLDGVYYLLIALGLSLIFSLGGIVNLAHGAFYAIGAYLTLVLSPYLGFGGSFIAAPIAVALLGM